MIDNKLIPMTKWEIDLLDQATSSMEQPDPDLDDLETRVLAKLQSEAGSEPAFVQVDAVQRQNARIRRRFQWIVILAAALVIISSSFIFAASRGWDVELAKAFGVSNMMEELGSGYVHIGVYDRNKETTVTANQAIGDDTSQWIQIDTNINWIEDDEYSVDYLPNKSDLKVMNLLGLSEIDGGFSLKSYNNHGKVSYWLFPTAYKDINRAKMIVTIDGIKRTRTDDFGNIISEEVIDDNTYTLKWKNVYDAHVRTFKIDEDIQCKLDAPDEDHMVSGHLTEVKISPITMYLTGIIEDEKLPNDYMGAVTPQVKKLRLMDGTIVNFESWDATYSYDGGSSGKFSAFLTLVGYDEFKNKETSVNGNAIQSIFIEDKEIILNSLQNP